MVVLVGGEIMSLKAACDAVESKVPVLVVANTGGAADSIAKAFARKKQQSVIFTFLNNYLSLSQ